MEELFKGNAKDGNFSYVNLALYESYWGLFSMNTACAWEICIYYLGPLV